jgi:hypothetical protein
MNPITIADLEKALADAGISQDEVSARAATLLEDLERYRISEVRLLRPFSTRKGLVVEYEFGKTAYSVDNARPDASPNFKESDHGGSQLNRDNLLFLVRSADIARELVPDMWLHPDADLKGKLRSPRQHLDTLNEFWWLSRWKRGAKIKPNQRINPKCGMDVDWQMTWDFGLPPPLTVNVEVKRRVDVLRMAQGHGIDITKVFAAGLEDKKGNFKFRESTSSEINVLALTLLGEIDHEVQLRAGDWLQTRPDIDAVLLFTRFSDRRSGFDTHIVRKHKLLNQVLVKELSSFDKCLHSMIEKPLPYPLSQLPFLP